MIIIKGLNGIMKNDYYIKPPVNHDVLFYIPDFVKELKKQIPGLILHQSHIYKTVKEIERLLDIDVFFEEDDDEE